MAEFFVHESSYVDDGAQVGRGTKIWHFCHVMPGAVIGERCNLGQNVVVMPGVRIGNNAKIQNNVSIYEGVTLEDDVFCGPSCVFTNVMRSEEHTSELQSQSNLVCRLLLEKKNIPELAVLGVPLAAGKNYDELMRAVPRERLAQVAKTGRVSREHVNRRAERSPASHADRSV